MGSTQGKADPEKATNGADGRSLRRRYRALTRAAKRSRRRPSPEAFHQTRVATRRLRAALRLLEEARALPDAHAEATALRRVGRRVGKVRDLDVVAARVKALVEGAPPDARVGVDDFLKGLRSAREKARRRVVRHLASKDFRKLRARLAALVARAEGSRKLRDGLNERGASVLRARAERLLGFEERAGSASLEDLHRLRIRVKRFRYSLELLGGTSPRRSDLLAVAETVQGHLGVLNDAVVAEQAIERFLAERNEDETTGIRALLHTFRADQARLRAEFERIWQELRDALGAWVTEVESSASTPRAPGVRAAGAGVVGPGLRRATESAPPEARPKRA